MSKKQKISGFDELYQSIVDKTSIQGTQVVDFSNVSKGWEQLGYHSKNDSSSWSKIYNSKNNNLNDKKQKNVKNNNKTLHILLNENYTGTNINNSNKSITGNKPNEAPCHIRAKAPQVPTADVVEYTTSATENTSYDESKHKMDEVAECLVNEMYFHLDGQHLSYYIEPICKASRDKDSTLRDCKATWNRINGMNADRVLSEGQWSTVFDKINRWPALPHKPSMEIKIDEFVCKNGVFCFDLDSNRIVHKAPSPSMGFRAFCDSTFNPNEISRGDAVNHFFQSISHGDQSIEVRLWETIGCIITQSLHMHKKFFWCKGVKDAGKSTFANLIIDIVGKANCSSFSLQEFAGARFYTADLASSILNVCLDMSSDVIKDTSILKRLTGQDLIKGERKGKDPFTFENRCQFLLGSNTYVTIKNPEQSKAFWDRLIVIPFDYSVLYKDTELRVKLSKERNFIIYHALLAYAHLKDRDFQFTPCQRADEVFGEFKAYANPTISFANECCVFSEKCRIHTSELHKALSEYCKAKGFDNTPAQKIMTESLKDEYARLISKKWQEGDSRGHGLVGIALKADWRDSIQ